jgi:hypothetical protein
MRFSVTRLRRMVKRALHVEFGPGVPISGEIRCFSAEYPDAMAP